MAELKGKKILVTGGVGFLGSHLVDRLCADNEVIVFDDLSSGSMHNINWSSTFVKLNILDWESLSNAVKEIGRVDVVFHLAAETSAARSMVSPYYCLSRNVLGVLNMLEVCRGLSVERFVFASSAAVYGDKGQKPISEDSEPNALSPYAMSKLIGESQCLDYSNMFGVPSAVLRFFNIYGTRQKCGAYAAVIPSFVSSVKSKMPALIFGDGEQTRDFVHVSDAVEASVLAASNLSAIGQVFNIGSGVATTVNRIARIICGDRVAYANARSGEVRHSVADISKAHRVLGYEPKVKIEDGLKAMLGECK